VKRYVLSAVARLDTLQIWHYLCDNASMRAADSIASELREAMKMLAAQPGLGHVRLDLTDKSIRFWNVRSYLIIYRPDKTPIEIARILHASRDVKAILNQES
jgi:plasmid stabilization system protein ParE